MSQKLAQMTTENGGADGLALCDWAPGPLSLTRSVFSLSLPDWGTSCTTEPKGRSKLAAAAGGFGLGWAGLGCAYCTVPVGSLPGSGSQWGPALGMDGGTRL